MKRYKIKFAHDYWVGIDKIYHLIACLLITVVFGWQTALVSGFFKEVSDIRKTGFSYKDIVWDCIGIVIGLQINTYLKTRGIIA